MSNFPVTPWREQTSPLAMALRARGATDAEAAAFAIREVERLEAALARWRQADGRAPPIADPAEPDPPLGPDDAGEPPQARIGYACRLAAGHEEPCDFRTAQEVERAAWRRRGGS